MSKMTRIHVESVNPSFFTIINLVYDSIKSELHEPSKSGPKIPDWKLILALAAQYCYFDHGISYEDWTGDKNDFSELFSELASPPEIVQFKNFGYFLTILRTDDEIIVTFPGTRKNIHGLKDLGES